MINLKSFAYKWTNSELFYIDKSELNEDEEPLDLSRQKTVKSINNILWNFWQSSDLFKPIIEKHDHSKSEEILKVILSGMKLTKSAIEFGFTTRKFNQAMIVFLSHIFAKFN